MLMGKYLAVLLLFGDFLRYSFFFFLLLSPGERHQQYNGGGGKRKERGTKLLEKGGKEGLGWMVV